MTYGATFDAFHSSLTHSLLAAFFCKSAHLILPSLVFMVSSMARAAEPSDFKGLGIVFMVGFYLPAASTDRTVLNKECSIPKRLSDYMSSSSLGSSIVGHSLER